mmetsp:Transcript_18176/g.23927  ORF Transcript_18176/g.23927 Transcript_18176/m.23927 type:complete len:267 (-) Transcript_18176:487-1287(-)
MSYNSKALGFFFLAAVVALNIFQTFAAVPKPTINVVVKDTKVSSIDALDVSAEYQVDITEEVVAGLDYQLQNNKYGPANLFVDMKLNKLKSSAVYNTIDNEFYFSGNYAIKNSNVGVSFTSLFKDAVVSATSSISLKDGFKTLLNPSFKVASKDFNMQIAQQISKSKLKDARLSFKDLFKQPKLAATCELSRRMTFSPSLDVEKKKLTYVLEHLYEGGSLMAKLAPKDVLSLVWKDEGKAGTWTAAADIKLEKKDIEFSFRRNFVL